MKNIILTILISAAVYSSLWGQENSAGALAAKADALQEILSNAVDNNKIFGTSFCLSYKGEVWCGSAGNIDLDQQYFIASTTKLFVTAIILHFVSEDKVALDDKISSYLDPDVMQGLHVFRGVEYSGELTIRNLLAHTSGLPDYFEDKGADGKSLEDELFLANDQSWTFEEAIERTRNLEPLFAPSEMNKAHYSDANYQLLGKLIENVSGKTFSENCQELIIQPLELSRTYLYTDSTDLRPLTLYYKQNELVIPKAMTSFGADGGMVSTSGDMLIFIEAFFNGRIFPKSYIEELQVWNKIFSPLQAGIGIHLFKLPGILGMPELIGHSGLSGALAYYDPEDEIYIAGTVNQLAYPSSSFTVATKLIQTVLNEQKETKIKTVSALGVGVNYSQIVNNEAVPKIGLTLDLYKEYKIFKPLSFTAEIAYNQKGERSTVETRDISLHYIDLPLMLRINLLQNKLGLSSGFSTNFLLASNKEKNTFQRFEYSLPFAINYSINDFFQLSFRYSLGITDLARDAYIDQGLKNNFFSITLLLVKP